MKIIETIKYIWYKQKLIASSDKIVSPELMGESWTLKK